MTLIGPGIVEVLMNKIACDLVSVQMIGQPKGRRNVQFQCKRLWTCFGIFLDCGFVYLLVKTRTVVCR